MRKEKPKVSIITVVYNGEKTIEQTIQSVLNQTYHNIEYIIVDGCSEDNTINIVKRYEKRISRIIQEPDHGLYDAMNKGIRCVSGELIGMINSDDWYEADAVEKIVGCFNRTDAEVVHGDINLIDEDGISHLVKPVALERIWYTMPISHPSVFVKRSVYERFGGFDLQYAIVADYELMLRLFCQHVKFEYLEEKIANFRRGGLTTTKEVECVEELRSISLRYIENCDEREKYFPKIEEEYRWKIFRAMSHGDGAWMWRILERKFQTLAEGITIFGTGIWGINCFKLLNSCSIKVSCFVDNDRSKWGQKLQEICIITPDELRNRPCNVLIATRLYASEIAKQLDTLENEELHYITLEELADCAYEEYAEAKVGKSGVNMSGKCGEIIELQMPGRVSEHI